MSHAVFRGIPVRSSDFGAVVHHSAFLSLLQPGQRAMHRGNTVEEIPILRQVTVLATGANFGQAPAASAPGEGGNTFGNITLALNPRQTAILALAEQAGTLRVALEPAQPPSGGPLPALPESALFGGFGQRTSTTHSPTVQYIIGSPGQNQTLTLPLATPATQAAAPTPPPNSVPAAVKAMTASTQQALSNLQALLRQSPLPSQPTAEKP
ncbi:MAG: hypothetical protein J0I24_00130 [Thiomonas arsenitoxydans]|uniref:Flp pilus assembly protein RcpC/CpaB domain-containing protein n=1 Tax=Thiomonas arsenitoxydans (strain DSM 22701 / CIP 110005 / 3As) TaxID=426114 RepID=A0A8I1MUS1_THIA3|nr:RcpC/CpaB family pilus assembly protein [Thiomonas arsenitoxydans]MBN8742693.1 hypothetical protein [Thiomonas arsenitoxydans]